MMIQQRILLTGGTGFAGRSVLKRLIADGYRVFVLVRNKEKLERLVGPKFLKSCGVTVIERLNPEKSTLTDLKRLIEENQITTILHLAAIAREFPKISWEQYLETNVLWPKNLALAFYDANVEHNKFIFISTVGVYGTIPNCIPACEETAYNPDGKYHKSKKMAELELLALKSDLNLPLVIVRPSIMYGFEDFGFLYKLFNLSKKKRYPLSSNNPVFHLLDVELFAEVCSKFIDLKMSKYHIFNVCDEESIAAKELLDSIKDHSNSGYLKINSSLFSVLKLFFSLSPKRLITLNLISKSWSYNTHRVFDVLDLDSKGILHNLEHKYRDWYFGGANEWE